MQYKAETETITGLVATTGVDKVNDAFTKAALKGMAEQLKEDVKTVDAFFMESDVDPSDFDGTTGNVDHNNDPAAAALGQGDPRIVPAFKLVAAEYVEDPLPGVQAGVRVKARLNTDGNPDDVAEAIRNSIKNNFVDSMSVEYVPVDTQKVERDGQTVRLIKEAKVRGSAITSRPVNPRAKLTDVNLKSLVQNKVEYAFDVGQTVSWDSAGGRTQGTVRDRTKDACFDNEIDGDVKVCGTEDEPAYLIEVDNDEGTMVGHKQVALSSTQKSLGIKQETLEELDLVPPSTAQENAQQALDWRDEYPDEIEGMTRVGWNRARQLASGSELSPADIADGTDGMANWWARHEDNFELDDEFEGEPWKDAGYVAGLGWGGTVGKNWAMRMKDKIEEIRSSKSTHRESKKTVAGVTFSGTKEGTLDESRIPNDDYRSHYLFDEDTKSESSYPVVDADGFLRRGNVDAAHQLGARGGVSEDELDQKLRALNNEFDNPPIDFDDEKNVMGDNPDNEVTQDDLKELKSDFELKTEELESTIDDLQSKNEELQKKNDELSEKLEDYKSLESVSEDVDELKSQLEDLEKETEPIRNKTGTQYESELEQYVAKTLDLANADYVRDNKEQIASDQDVSVDQVEQALQDIQGDS
jgi:hypothetical protein